MIFKMFPLLYIASFGLNITVNVLNITTAHKMKLIILSPVGLGIFAPSISRATMLISIIQMGLKREYIIINFIQMGLKGKILFLLNDDGKSGDNHLKKMKTKTSHC